MRPLLVPLAAFLLVPCLSLADDHPELRAALAKTMPDIAIGTIRESALPGLFEVQADGINIFYVDEKGTTGFFGNAIDLKTRTNLTEQRRAELKVVDFSRLPVEKAIVRVKGNGLRKIAIFSDPDCPYCKQLERELKDVTDVTIYVFLYPLGQIHPDAKRKATLIWCSADRAAAWDEMMLADKEPAGSSADCETPIASIEEIARRFWINGTPGIIFGNGTLVPGVPPKDQIEALLGSSERG